MCIRFFVVCLFVASVSCSGGTEEGGDVAIPDLHHTDVVGDSTPHVLVDLSPELPADTTPDVPADTTPDVPADTTPDVPADTAPDVPADTTPDVPADTAPDVPPDLPCVPVCDGLECGDDGCGGSCGDCSGHGDCVEGDGVAVCDCTFPWIGEACDGCADSYELDDDAGVCAPLAEYVVKELSAGGRYLYSPTVPRPSNIRDEVWVDYPFRGVDSAMRIETPTGYWAEIFTDGDQYVLLHDGAWKSCPTAADCSVSVAGPSPLCPGGTPDAFWGSGFPFCDGVDSMTQIGLGAAAVQVLTSGTQYVQWSAAHGYHHWPDGAPAPGPGPGTIGDASWGDAYPFATIDALVDYADVELGEDRLLFVSGREVLDCSLAMSCQPVFELGTPGDDFFPYLWQTLPFAQVPDWDTPVDAIIRSGSSGSDLYITSNTPLPRPETAGELRIFDSISGPPQRALVLRGAAAEQGHTQGVHLGEEIAAVLNEIIIPFYNDTLVDPVAIAGGKTGYQAVRELVERFDFDGDLAIYVDELQGMLDGIETHLGTNRQLFDGELQWTMDPTDLIALQLVDDLWGTHCKSGLVWPAGGVALERPYHISVIDWDTALGPYNVVVAYDNSEDAGRMSWIGPSWSGNIAGFLFGLNEAGAMYSYVSSGGELRRCPEGSGPCLDQRFADLEGLPLHSTAFVTRRSFELASTIDEAWALLEDVTTMTVSSFAMTELTSGEQSGVIIEIVYPGIEAMWGTGQGYTFHPTPRPNQLLHFAPDPDGEAFVPILASVALRLGIVDIPDGDLQPAWLALRDGLAGLLPAGVTTAALIDVVDDPPVYGDATTQITIGEAIVDESGNHSVIDVFFSGRKGHNVWGDGASHGTYLWDDLLGPDDAP